MLWVLLQDDGMAEEEESRKLMTLLISLPADPSKTYNVDAARLLQDLQSQDAEKLLEELFMTVSQNSSEWQGFHCQSRLNCH